MGGILMGFICCAARHFFISSTGQKTSFSKCAVEGCNQWLADCPLGRC